MQKNSLFNQITDTLKSKAEIDRYACVSREVLNDFFMDVPGKNIAEPASVSSLQENSSIYNSRSRTSGNTAGPSGPIIQKAKPSSLTPATGAPTAQKPVESMGWQELADAVAQCRKCKLCQNRIKTVFGAGNQNADLMFIGEGPGADEDRQGIPFVGRVAG